MTDVIGPRRTQLGSRRSERTQRFLIAIVVMAVALGSTQVLQDRNADTFAPLVGAIAIVCWYLGPGAGLAALTVGFVVAWFAALTPYGSWGIPSRREFLGWLASLAVSLIVLWVSWALRRAGRRATARAETAEHERHVTEAVQRLATGLSSALTPSEVARTLVERLPDAIGATGAALALVEGDGLHVVDPSGATREVLAPGMRLELGGSTLIAAAARTGEVAVATSRDRYERKFPEGAALAREAAGGLAVPLRAGGDVLGSIGLTFDDPGEIDEEAISFARLAADLGAQALERAGLYEQERRSREALDRISRLALRFGDDSPESVLRTVCREARETFESDVAQIWSLDADGFRVVGRDPASELITPGSRVPHSDYPGLAESIRRLEPMFIADSWATVRGEALELARHLGIRSSLRMPIAAGGPAERVLVLQWTRLLPEPSPSMMLLARRFADQAGLALEQAERRVAESAASRSVEETRRLLDVTRALTAALEPAAVANATLREAFRGLGATAGAVVRLHADRTLELVTGSGYAAGTLDGWERFELDANVPLSDAVQRNELVALESPSERTRRYPRLSRLDTAHAAWLALPLVAGGRVVGGLALSFASPRTFSDGDRDFALALSRQAGQALERSTLLEDEHGARMRAERMASDLAQLHALATALGSAALAEDVVRIIGGQMVQGMGAGSAGVYTLNAERETLSLLSVAGRLTVDDLAGSRELSLDGPSAVADCVRSARSVWLSAEEQLAAYPQSTVWPSAGASAVGIVPLVVEEAAIGALFVVFDDGSEPTGEDRRFAETVARQAAQPLERVRLLEEERASRLRAERANLQIRRIQTVTERLASAATMAAVADVAVHEGSALLVADGVFVHVREPGGDRLELLASHGCPPDLLGPVRSLGMDVATPIRDAYLSGTTVEVHERDRQAPSSFEEFERAMSEWGFRSILSVPLAVGADAVGVLTAAFVQDRGLDDDDRRAALIMGRQCAQALERSRLFDEERVARDRSERLKELTTALSSALTSQEVVGLFLDHAARALGASAVAIGLLDDGGAVGADGWQGDRGCLAAPWLDSAQQARTPVRDAIASGRPLYFDGAGELGAAYRGLGPVGGDDERSFAFVPLLAGRKLLAATVLTSEPRAFSAPGERAFVETFSSQCAQALDRAQRYETERTIAETLQRSVLPETLPSMEGATVAARYLPGTAAIDVGGDWFDTIPLPDGRLGFVVGDVVGKGVEAAATMAQLRNGMRALMLDSADPAAVVTGMNRLLDAYTSASFATLAFVVVDPRTHETSVISAGHLPPLVISPGREPRLLDQGRGLPLGVDPEATYEAWPTTLEPGSVIVLYTDGLVERRDRSLDEGLQLLTDAVRGASDDPEQLVDLVLERLVGGHDRGDDVAVIVVGLDHTAPGAYSVRLPSARDSLVELRQSFAGWLELNGIAESDRRDLMLATWEASANAIEHARNPSESVIEVEATLTGDRVRVEVTDTGLWHESDERPDRGLGLHLIHALMTSLTVEPGADGTRVVMERALSRERAGDGSANGADHRAR